MLDNPMLGVAIGLVFFYLLLSIIATVLQEFIASFLKLRNKNLQQAIVGLIGDANKRDFFAHPLIFPLFKGDLTAGGDPKEGGPAYIPKRNFALAILDLQEDKAATSPDGIAVRRRSAACDQPDSCADARLQRQSRRAHPAVRRDRERPDRQDPERNHQDRRHQRADRRRRRTEDRDRRRRYRGHGARKPVRQHHGARLRLVQGARAAHRARHLDCARSAAERGFDLYRPAPVGR